MKSTVILILSLLAALSTGNALAVSPVYKWTDDQGVIQYTRYKPTDRKWQEVGSPPPPPSFAPDLNKSAADQILDAAEKNKQRKKDANVAAGQKSDDELNARQCKTARSSLDTVTNRARISYKGKNGETIRMPEEERSVRKKKYQEYIDANCK